MPELIDPRRAVSSGSRYEGSIAVSRLPRLRALLETVEGSADYRVGFSKDGRGFGVVNGRVVAELRLRCQRCNGAMTLPVDSAFSLALIDGLDEAAALPDEYDPLLLDGRLLRSSELVEDELLLAVPVVPRHPHGSCEAPLDRSHSAEQLGEGDGPAEADPSRAGDGESGAGVEPASGAEQIKSEPPNPFAALAVLRRDRKE